MKTRKNKLKTIAIMAAITLLGAMANVHKIHAATITVTSTADAGPDTLLPGTLREALANAMDGDTIDATSITGTITLVTGALTTGELRVTTNLTIVGSGPANLTVDGDQVGRVFHLHRGLTVTISGLTISNGLATGQFPGNRGGGIYNDRSTLTVSNCTLNGNTADLGGGIYNDGSDSGSATLTVIASTLSVNSADSGGGIFNDGGSSGSATLTVIASTLSGNSAGAGGGIYSDAFMGGSAVLTVANSILNDNSAEQGGAILNARSTLEVSTCTFSGNSASFRGGGMLTAGGSQSMRVTHTTFSGNSSGGGGFGGDGGGICNAGSTLEVSTSTISGNSADHFGGGIFNGGLGGGTLLVANTTLSGNSAFLGGGIINFTETGSTPTVDIGNSILKAGSLGGSIYANVPGSVTSRGFNLSSDAAGGDASTGPGGLLDATGDQRNTDPKLGPLADNGGPTRTHALLPGSPAIDGGESDTIPALVTATDQRGFARTFDDPATTNAPFGDGTDIGAVELQQSEAPNNAPVAKCKNVTVVAGPGGTASASIDDGSFDPDGDPITIVQTPPGPYPVGSTTVTLAVTDSHGLSNSCSSVVTVVGVSDLLVSLAVDKTSVKQGDQLTYTITVHNFGPQDAANVAINDTLSSGSTFVSAHANRGNFTTPAPNQTGVVTWNLGDLPNGDIEGAQLVVKVIVRGKTTITNTATASTDSADPNPANNSASITTSVAAGGGKK